MKQSLIIISVLTLTNFISLFCIGLGATGTLTMAEVYDFIGYEWRPPVEEVEHTPPGTWSYDTNWSFDINDTIYGVHINIQIFRGNGTICWRDKAIGLNIITNFVHYHGYFRMWETHGCDSMLNQTFILTVLVSDQDHIEGKSYRGTRI